MSFAARQRIAEEHRIGKPLVVERRGDGLLGLGIGLRLSLLRRLAVDEPLLRHEHAENDRRGLTAREEILALEGALVVAPADDAGGVYCLDSRGKLLGYLLEIADALRYLVGRGDVLGHDAVHKIAYDGGDLIAVYLRIHIVAGYKLLVDYLMLERGVVKALAPALFLLLGTYLLGIEDHADYFEELDGLERIVRAETPVVIAVYGSHFGQRLDRAGIPRLRIDV